MIINAIIEKNENNYYQISSDDELFGSCFGGYGYSLEEAKADFFFLTLTLSMFLYSQAEREQMNLK